MQERISKRGDPGRSKLHGWCPGDTLQLPVFWTRKICPCMHGDLTSGTRKKSLEQRRFGTSAPVQRERISSPRADHAWGALHFSRPLNGPCIHPAKDFANRARFIGHQNSPVSVERTLFLTLFLPTRGHEDPKNHGSLTCARTKSRGHSITVVDDSSLVVLTPGATKS